MHQSITMQIQAPDCNSNASSNSETSMSKQEQLDCPRCGSNNTKFCYYNNYNTSQPRHFCKNCRRYWTKGGALRNIPIGGGTRKKSSKRPVKKSIAKPIVMSTPAAEAPVIHPQPVSMALYQSTIPTDLNGYNFGNFNLSITGFPLAAPEMQSSTESSGGANDIFTLNGNFSYLCGGWQ